MSVRSGFLVALGFVGVVTVVAMAIDKSPPEKVVVPKEQADAAKSLIRAWGYDCRTVDDVVPNAWTYVTSHESFTVACNNYRYLFTIENHGGRWSVKSG